MPCVERFGVLKDATESCNWMQLSRLVRNGLPSIRYALSRWDGLNSVLRTGHAYSTPRPPNAPCLPPRSGGELDLYGIGCGRRTSCRSDLQPDRDGQAQRHRSPRLARRRPAQDH